MPFLATVGFTVLANYLATSDYVQHPRRCVEILDKVSLTATGEGANFTLKKEMAQSLLTIAAMYKCGSAFFYS